MRFTSVQDPSYGTQHQSCSEWSMTYELVRSGERWLIDSVSAHAGTPEAC